MIRSIYLSPEGIFKTQLDVDEYAGLLEKPTGLLWVDFEATKPESDEIILQETFGFHPLAIDDALLESHVPKLDDWDEYLYIVLHAVVFDSEAGDHVDTLEVDFFLGKNYLVTHHDQKINAIDHVWDNFQVDDRLHKNGSGHLFYRIADEIVASYMPVVELLDEAIDRSEDQVFTDPTPVILERIFRLKRVVLHLRRMIGPQREVFNKLARDEIRVVGKRERVYFRDIYDHLVRLYDITESIRDLVSGSLDTYLSVVNNRMNEIMKTLTIITTLFMPISFVASFFGMNFFVPLRPFVTWTKLPVFLLVLFIMLLTPSLMLMWVRRKGWI